MLNTKIIIAIIHVAFSNLFADSRAPNIVLATEKLAAKPALGFCINMITANNIATIIAIIINVKTAPPILLIYIIFFANLHLIF